MRIDRRALEIARVDIGYARNACAALAWIKIGIEHAIRPRKLQLRALALTDLKARPAEMLAQLIGGHSIQRGMVMAIAFNRYGRGVLDRLGCRS